MNGVRHTGYSTSKAPDNDNIPWVSDEISGLVSGNPAIYGGKVYVNANGRIDFADLVGLFNIL